MNKIGLQKELVEVVKYNPNWIEEFQSERDILKQILTDFDVKIEHIGSTSVPHLDSKPIIDIMIGFKNIEDRNNAKIQLLIKNYNLSAFQKEESDILMSKGFIDIRTHFFHLVIFDSTKWNRYICFRNYLSEFEDIKLEYSILKKDFALKAEGNRKIYATLKEEFIEKNTNLALEYYCNK